jgi:hypothetical protein
MATLWEFKSPHPHFKGQDSPPGFLLSTSTHRHPLPCTMMNQPLKDPNYLHLINVVGLQRSYTKAEQQFIERTLHASQQQVSQKYLIAKSLGLI